MVALVTQMLQLHQRQRVTQTAANREMIHRLVAPITTRPNRNEKNVKFDPFKHHRRSNRLPGYDYAQAGAYFITICVQGHECLFGNVIDGIMDLNEIGQIVAEEWLRSMEIRKEIEFDEWVVMPNHVQGIVVIAVGATGRSPLQTPQRPRGPSKRSIGSFVAGFKSATTTRVNELRGTPGTAVWQRNYHDHIIRNERERNAIVTYICNNPVNWSADLNHPGNLEKHPRRPPGDYRRNPGAA